MYTTCEEYGHRSSFDDSDEVFHSCVDCSEVTCDEDSRCTDCRKRGV